MMGLAGIASKPLSAEAVQVVALYHPESGEILHLHMVTTFAGATPPTLEEAVEEAKRLAQARHIDVDALAVALSNNREHCYSPHRIDPATKGFVPLFEREG